MGEYDYVDQIIEQWSRVRADADVSAMGVIGRISRAAHILSRRLEEVFSDMGVHGGRFDVLAALRRAGPPHTLTPTALYNSLLISSGAITNRLDRLTSEGLVERLPSPDDGRYLLVKLTPAGLAAVDAALIVHIANENDLLSGLDAEEEVVLASILRKLLVELGDQPHASYSVDPTL